MKPQSDSQVTEARLVRGFVRGGYLDGFDVEFPRGGAVVIGEHGSGKSTLLSLLGFGFDVPVPEAHKAERESLLEANLANGRVYWVFERPGDGVLCFSRALTRPKGKDVPHEPPRFEAEYSRPGPPIAWSKDLFPIHVSGHGELAMLSVDGKARLDLVERFAGPELKTTQGALATARTDLDKKSGELATVEGEIDLLKQATASLDGLVARLAQLKAEAGADPVDLGAATTQKARRVREEHMMEQAPLLVEGLAGDVARIVSLWPRRLEQCFEPEVALGPNAALLEPVGPALANLATTVNELGTAVLSLCEKARALFREVGAALKPIHSRQEDDYRAETGKHEHNAARARERVDLEGKVALLQKQREEHDTKVAERAAIAAAHERLLARHDALFDQERAIWDGICDRLTKATEGAVTVKMEHDVDRSAYRALLSELVKKKNFEGKTIEAIAAGVGARDLFRIIMDSDAARLAPVVGSTTTAERFNTVMREKRAQYRLLTAPVVDHPAMVLVHEEEKKRHDELSSGQRIATFVRLMLLDRRGPFVADTPENDVSGYHLATQLCPALAQLDTWGQYVIVSHDPNVPVLGKARKIIELFSPNGRCGIVRVQGPPKKAMVPMENHLEGGRAAFVTRKDFYDDR
jgi:ABC-type lipoprotein export system ATPase subunit